MIGLIATVVILVGDAALIALFLAAWFGRPARWFDS